MNRNIHSHSGHVLGVSRSRICLSIVFPLFLMKWHTAPRKKDNNIHAQVKNYLWEENRSRFTSQSQGFLLTTKRRALQPQKRRARVKRWPRGRTIAVCSKSTRQMRICSSHSMTGKHGVLKQRLLAPAARRPRAARSAAAGAGRRRRSSGGGRGEGGAYAGSPAGVRRTEARARGDWREAGGGGEPLTPPPILGLPRRR